MEIQCLNCEGLFEEDEMIGDLCMECYYAVDEEDDEDEW